MLTETLAMYTEVMLLKKMYGKQKASEHVKMHQDIYESEIGFSGDVALIRAPAYMAHITYSKGVVAMYKLSELIGEEKVNLALRNFLEKNKFPNPKPISTDFLKELYAVVDEKFHEEIYDLFEK
jgi:ABC-2 type transport system permease protein